MKKHALLLALFAFLLTPLAVYSQESPVAAQRAESPEKEAQDNPETGVGRDLLFKWINFGIFAGGLGYFIVKKGPAFFSARTADIQKAIKDATGLKMEADFRSSEIDRKMATLGAEVQRLRDESKLEMEREHERILRETEAGVKRLQQHFALEVASLQQNARTELRRHTSELAVSMAASRLRDQLTGDDQSRLIGFFADAVQRGNN
ncbi:MAG: ATP synthase F0 subunit B [Bryobacteraceae bacterium]